MPISFTYDEFRDLLLTRAEGNLSFDEIRAHLEAEDKARRLGSPELFDATGATTTLTSHQAKQLVAQLKGLAGKTLLGPTAVVTDSRMGFGMARMLAILSELQSGPLIGVFPTVAEGLDWLFGLNGR